ncbi:hypothetical protein [Hymenobacter negativus]|uniref:Uncharacterized protein n=1 Tax=Hymenobacter negativus TaxID=2795026 RepID=A0ABS3QIP3_9BACT|nr:hypothetical protein [Hymenobacter negativus]MBO2011114.1 hypothetical protein [Hymenobacter negativus]
MDNTTIVARLQKIGPMPDSDMSEMATFLLEEFDHLLQQLTKPLEPAHALVLINLGPPPDTSAYEVEWALVHAAESLPAEELYGILLLANNTEVKRLIETRLKNSYSSLT